VSDIIAFDIYEHRHKLYTAKIDSLVYLSVADSMGRYLQRIWRSWL